MCDNIVCEVSLVKKSGDPQSVVRLTPADVFGHTRKCCCIIPLKLAACIVCVFSFIWAAAEFAGTNRQVADIIPDKRSVWFVVTKVVYLVLAFGLAVASGLLMMGIVREKYTLVNYYVWYVSLYAIVFVATAVASVVCVLVRTGNTPKRHMVRMAAVAVWMCILIYFLVVVNSFKYTLWRSLIGHF